MEISQYTDIFIEESNEHLQSMNDCLLKLESEPENIELLNEIFRVSHTLKGMAATMGFEQMSKLTHQSADHEKRHHHRHAAARSRCVQLLPVHPPPAVLPRKVRLQEG